MQGTEGSRDDTGLITLSVPYFVSTLSDALTIGKEPPLGLEEVGRDWEDIEGFGEDGGFRVVVKYEGFEDGKEEGEETFEYTPGFSEEPIESHPLYLNLLEIYQGVYDPEAKSTTWPLTYQSKSNGLKASGGKDAKNPMLDVNTFILLTCTFVHTYSARVIPDNLVDRIGELRDDLPGGFPTPSGRNWMLMAPRIRKRGNAFTVTEEWLLSPAGGEWSKAVYALLQKF